MVRLHASSLGLAPGFGVLDAGDAGDLLDFVRQEQGHAASRRRFPRAQTMLDIYSRTVNAQTPLAEVLAESFPWCEEHREALGESSAPTARASARSACSISTICCSTGARSRPTR